VLDSFRSRPFSCDGRRADGLGSRPGAALVSTDAEFGRRRMSNATGHHVWLKCPDWDASDVLAKHLTDVIARLTARPDLTVRVSPDTVIDSSDWR
jgi:hypothetical protein